MSGALATDPNFGLGGRYSEGLLETGLRSYSGQLNRRQIDNTLLKRLLAGEPFELDCTITSRVYIGSSTDPYEIRLVAPLCVFSGSAPGVPVPMCSRNRSPSTATRIPPMPPTPTSSPCISITALRT